MVSSWSYTITYYNSESSWASTDITDDMVALPVITDTGTGDMREGKIILSADGGKYVKSVGGSPKIKQLDRIRIVLNDGLQPSLFNHVFDVMKITPVKTKNQGTRVQLTLLGIEHWLDKVNYTKPHYFETAFNVFKDIGEQYNSHKGTLAPTLKGHGSTSLPKYVHNIYDYGLNEETCFTRMVDVVDKLGASADAGGVLDFFEIRFTASSTSVEEMTVSVTPSGRDPLINVVTIEGGDNNVNVGESEGGIEAMEGTVINAWGAIDGGSLPIQFSRFKSRQQVFPRIGNNLFAKYVAGQTYLAGSIVQNLLGLVYKALVDTTTVPESSGDWEQLIPATYYGNVITYSPWTDDSNQGAKLWGNCGSNPTGLFNKLHGRSCWDANIVIRDTPKNEPQVFRTWADLKANSDNYTILWKYGSTPEGVYRGTRCLVVGTGGGAFAVLDKNGRSFTNAIAEYTGNEWIVKYNAVQNMMCAVIDTAQTWRFDGTTWTVLSDAITGFSTDCFHNYDSITNTASQTINPDTGLPFTVKNTLSAITVVYTWVPVLVVTAGITSFRNNTVAGSPVYYSAGAWLNFRFPFPPNKYNNSSKSIGQLYGGARQINGDPDSDKEPTTLDIQNMHLTHDGYRGFNAPSDVNGSASQDLGQISSLDFMMKMKWTDTGILLLVANFKMRCYMFDINDNVVFQDFIINFNDEWQSVQLPVSGFQTYRGRNPSKLPAALGAIIIPKALDAQEIFEWRHVKQMCFQTQESYDAQGRYAPELGRYAPIATPFPTLNKLELSIDAFRFTKPLLVNSGNVSDRDIEPAFLQKPEIGNFDQLKSDVSAELEKSKFQRVQYDIMTTGKTDIKFGNSFFLKDSEIVPTFSPAQPGETTDKVRLVAKKIEYSITKPVEGKGGFLRTITGVRRFK